MPGDAASAEHGASYPDGERFARCAAAFEELSGLGGAQRAAALQALAADDPQLADEVRRLLQLHEQPAGALADPQQAIDPQLLATALDDSPGELGPYRLLQRIGEGGMGAVWRAERADGEFQQVVAIKLLHTAAGELQQRFRTERRILASLQHPNIAALLDGGTAADGRAWVVMEYVDGRDLVAHAEAAALPLAARLQLFIKVCGAVEHAHRNLVVHRDLKPANILVTADGEPKLLDFGIAKLLARDADTAPTLTGSLLLTPEYASPEQVRGEPITTATDVYALGVILHELLSGQRAQSFTTRTPRELEQVVCERQPPPPSQALGVRLPAMGLSRPRLQRLLQGDLDTIVQRALAKDPQRRYGGAEELADDLRRHLRGMPVRARPDTFAYLASKFLRRHRWPVAAAAAFVLVLLAATLVTAGMARTAAAQRDVAEQNSAIAAGIGSFLVELFELAQPDPMRADQLSARALLDRGSQRIAHELDQAPLERAGLLDAMGRAYLGLGLFDQAAPLLQQALALRLQVPADSASIAWSRLHLGQLHSSRADIAQGEPLLRQAAASFEALGDRRGEVQAQYQLAAILVDVGRNDEALQLATAVRDGSDQAYGSESQQAVKALQMLGRVHRERGDFAQALDCLDRALAICERRFGRDNAVAADVHRALGRTYKLVNEYDKAKASLQRALELDRSLLGDTHPDIDADLFDLAMLEQDLGEPEHAEQLLQQVLDRDRRTFGEHHAYVAIDLAQLASLRSNRGDYAAAEPMFEQALAMQRELLPADHPELANTLNNLGVCHHRQRRYDDAERCFREALQIRQRILPADHPALLTSRNVLAVLLQDRGEFAAAEAEFRSVLAARRQKLGEHSEVAGSLFSLAISVLAQRRVAEAEELLRQSLAMYRKTLVPQHRDLARPLHRLGRLLLERGLAAAAEPLLREAVECCQLHLTATHPDLASAECDLGRCLCARGELDAAAEVLQRARQRCQDGVGLEHPVGRRVQAALQELAARQKGG